MLTIEESDRRHASNLGYEDVLGQRYVWDSTVPNHLRVAVGDLVVIRDTRWILGLAWIDAIETSEGSKPRLRCPVCRRTDFEPRKTMTPRFRCKCEATFDVPFSEEIKVKMFAADYERTWRAVDAQIAAKSLEDLYLNESTQQSMRPVDLEATRHILDVGIRGGDPWWSDDGGVRPIPGGHKLILQKQRYGQSSFRQSLLRRFGSRCAISGPQPEATLEAAHLYRYAENAVHDLSGGLLLRRDLHTLFDRWSLAIDTATWSTRVSPELMAYPSLASLDGQPLNVPASLRPDAQYLDVHYTLARKAWASSP